MMWSVRCAVAQEGWKADEVREITPAQARRLAALYPRCFDAEPVQPKEEPKRSPKPTIHTRD